MHLQPEAVAAASAPEWFCSVPARILAEARAAAADSYGKLLRSIEVHLTHCVIRAGPRLPILSAAFDCGHGLRRHKCWQDLHHAGQQHL